MKTSAKYFLTLAAFVLFSSLAVTTQADPLPGQTLKFQQQPMINTSIPDPNGISEVYHGHDELSTLYGSPVPGANIIDYAGTAMADDFADPFDTPVVHVRWWGSYPLLNPNQRADRFLIAFESDVPADQNPVGNFSTPGEVLSSQIVDRVPDGSLLPGSGTFTETLVLDLPEPGEDIYMYNAELHLGKEFQQKPETVYWLKIAALIDVDPQSTEPRTQWGWHNRDYTVADPFALAVTPPILPGERDERIELGATYPTPVWHFQDDSVSANTTMVLDLGMPHMPLQVIQDSYEPQRYLDGLDGPGPFVNAAGEVIQDGIGLFSKDLAFELWTVPVPEPTTGLLVLMGMASLLATTRSRADRK